MTRASEGKRGGHNVVDHVDGEDEYGRYDIDSTAASIFVESTRFSTNIDAVYQYTALVLEMEEQDSRKCNVGRRPLYSFPTARKLCSRSPSLGRSACACKIEV